MLGYISAQVKFTVYTQIISDVAFSKYIRCEIFIAMGHFFTVLNKIDHSLL